MYSAWAAKRRLTYELAIAAVVIAVVGTILVVGLYEPPSCFDNKQNQDEAGVDCAGVCSLRCPNEVQKVATLWARSFEVSPGFYNAVAYLENPNLDSYAADTPYRFVLYDSENVLIYERFGTVTFNGDAVVPVFEGGIQTGGRTPTQTFFNFVQDPVWVKRTQDFKVVLEEQQHIPSPSVQRVEAVVRNTGVYELRDIEIVAIVYDVEKNALATSKTSVEYLLPQQVERISFTWPRPFERPVGPIELTPLIPLQEL